MGSDSDSDDDGDICLHSIDRDGDLLRTKNFGDKKKSRKKAKNSVGCDNFREISRGETMKTFTDALGRPRRSIRGRTRPSSGRGTGR